jgi:anti-anti-sigma factor
MHSIQPIKKGEIMEPSDSLVIAREKWGDWEIIILNGQFVVKSFSILREHFIQIEALQNPKVAVDLTEVIQLDSSALTVLLNFQRRLKEKNGRIVVIGPNSEIKETLFLVGFNMAVPIFATRALFEKGISAEK